MFDRIQMLILLALSVAFWVLATAYIHFLPGTFAGPLTGAIGFVTTLPVAWLSVLLARSIARLSPAQILPGVALVGAFAMLIDGVMLRWFSGVYADDPVIVKLGAAWLLWGYGMSLCIALLMTPQSKQSGLAQMPAKTSTDSGTS